MTASAPSTGLATDAPAVAADAAPTVVAGRTAPVTAGGAPTVGIVTLGCGRNEVDSDQLAGLLHRSGAALVDDPATADVVLVNTCTFIAPAKRESIDTVLAACDLKEQGARAVVVVGCMAERYPYELAEAIPEADAVVGFAGYPQLPDLLDAIVAGRPYERVVATPDHAPHPGAPTRPRATLPLLVMPTDVPQAPPEAAPAPPTRVPQDDLDRIPASGPRFPLRRYGTGSAPPWAYLKIASGCDRVCTFCAIPSFRGRFRSRPLDEIVAEAAWLAGRGARELVLVSENTTSWGKDLDAPAGGGRALQPRLLAELAAIDEVARIRLLYLQPAELQRPLLEAMAAEPKVAPYFDLSLQHAAPDVLARMARSGSPERFGALIGAIRALVPDAAFRTNVIVGFPGETDRDVDVLADFLRDQRLDWVGLFPYSAEDATPAATMDGQVPDHEIKARLDHLTDLQEHVADDVARGYVGRRLAVLVEETAGAGEEVATVGRSYREAPDSDGEVMLVETAGRPALAPGRIVDVDVVEAVGVDLVGRVRSEAPDRRSPSRGVVAGGG